MLGLFKQNKMFRVLLTYQFFSSIGGAMFSMFILLSVHLIYHNPIYTGIAGFLMAAPIIFSFAVGPVVDRRNKVKIMRITTFIEFLVLSLLAFTPLQEQFGVMFMFAVILTYNIAALFEAPAGTALLPQIVQDEKILEANSLINIVAMVGGIIIGAVLFTSLAGEINFSFLYGFSAVFLAMAFIISLFVKNTTVVESTEKPPSSNYLQDLKEGAKFIRRNILLFTIMAIVIMDFAGEIAYVNRPMFLEYHAGAQGYVLYALMGLVGGVVASYFVGMLGNKFKIGRLSSVLFVLAGIVRVVFALAVPRQLIWGLITMVVYVALASAVDTVFSSLNQKIPPKDMVGRVSTISRTFIAVFVALGAFVGGFLGRIVPAVDYIFIFQGVSYVVIGFGLVLLPSVRKLPKMNEIVKSEE
ncbi:MAG: MFS transporter [Defluviitaleaceae bacterium]|nr:MFS transporter [Defluviitaleaceae bacterium]